MANSSEETPARNAQLPVGGVLLFSDGPSIRNSGNAPGSGFEAFGQRVDRKSGSARGLLHPQVEVFARQADFRQALHGAVARAKEFIHRCVTGKTYCDCHLDHPCQIFMRLGDTGMSAS